jgi:tRNA A-37 threonylcarbamoyl transferase component Bud32
LVITMVGSDDGLALGEGIGRATWRATVAGIPVVARRLNGHVDQQMVRRLIGTTCPQLVRVTGVTIHDDTHWLLSEPTTGATVSRILTRATLTPAQAAHIASGLLAGLAMLHRAGISHGRLHAGNVLVDDSGRVRLTDWAVSSLMDTEASARQDVAAARELIGELARNAGRPSAHTRKDGPQRETLEQLSETASTLTAETLASATEQLRQPPDAQAEVGALVSAVVGQHREAPPRPVPPPEPVPVSSSPLAVPDGLLVRPARRLPLRWIAVAAAAVAVVVAIGIAVVSRGGTGHGTARAFAATPSHSTAPARSSVAPRPRAPQPVVAPRSAGFVSRVTAIAEAACQPGSECPVTVRVYVRGLADIATMTWSYLLVDRCTGTRTRVDGGTMIAQPWWQSAYDTRSIALPATRSLAIVGVVDSPVRAASAPLLVPAGSPAC